MMAAIEAKLPPGARELESVSLGDKIGVRVWGLGLGYNMFDIGVICGVTLGCRVMPRV